MHQSVYTWVNGKLYIFRAANYMEYPPLGLRELLIEEYHHDNMHVGADKLCDKLAAEYYWPTML